MLDRLKQGYGMVVYVVLMILFLALFNLASSRHYAKIDLTPDHIFTLSDQSVKIIKNLKEKVTLYAFVKPGGVQVMKDKLDQYSYISENVSYKITDPDKDPITAEKYNVTDYGTLVVETASGRKESTKQLDEESITNAIYKAITSKQKAVYVLQVTKEEIQKAWSR